MMRDVTTHYSCASEKFSLWLQRSDSEVIRIKASDGLEWDIALEEDIL